MRKIESQMVAAIRAKKDFKVANTKVVTGADTSAVYLYGSLIARIGETYIELFDGNHQTSTTKSRLNAILAEFGMAGEMVFQKGFEWFVRYDGATVPFTSGMRLN